MNKNRQAQKEYKQRMRLNGYTQITLWVPAEKKEEVKRFVQKLNKHITAVETGKDI